MNLVTSDNFKLFRMNGANNILIGSWCLIDKEIKKNFNKNRDKIAIYHWDNKIKMSEDLVNINKIYKYFLNQLCEILNDFHKTNYNLKSWEIFIGRWLREYVSYLFDRWEQMSYVSKNFKIDEVQLIKFDDERFVKSNMLDFHYMLHKSNWNHWIFGKIIESEKKFNFVHVNESDQLKKEYSIEKKEENFFTNLFNKFFSKFIFNQDLAITCLYLPRLYKFGLLLKYNKFIAKLNFDKKYEKKVNISLRKKVFKNIKGFDSFTNFVSSLICFNIPCSCFENFENLNTQIDNSILPKKPKMILTSTEHAFNDFFKLYCLKKKNDGAKLVIFQHGGNYFTAENSLHNNHEVEISDKFLTWGLSPKPNKTISLFISSVIKKKVKKNLMNEGIIVSTTVPTQFPGKCETGARYYSDIISYNNRIFNFIDNIDKKILSSSSIKMKEGVTEEQENYLPINFLKNNFPKIDLIINDQLIWKISKKYKIVVETVNSTGFLEAMYLNIPIILLIDRKIDRVNNRHKEDYKDLEKVNILHYNPVEAAKFINSIYDDPLKWWNEKNTQNVRKYFCSKFAKDKKNPYKELTYTLDNILLNT